MIRAVFIATSADSKVLYTLSATTQDISLENRNERAQECFRRAETRGPCVYVTLWDFSTGAQAGFWKIDFQPVLTEDKPLEVDWSALQAS